MWSPVTLYNLCESVSDNVAKIAENIIYLFNKQYLLHFQLSLDGFWEKELNLGEGVYEYKFLVNGVWFLDPSKPIVRHQNGITNNILMVGTLLYKLWHELFNHYWSTKQAGHFFGLFC